MGDCNPLTLRIPFKAKALGQLLASDAYPIVRITTDRKADDEMVSRLSFSEVAQPSWQVELTNLTSALFERIGQAESVKIQLIGRDDNGERILDDFGPVDDAGRKETMARVARECGGRKRP